jgi:hypothetical protein
MSAIKNGTALSHPAEARCVVDDALDRMRHAPPQLWRADLIGQQISVERMRDILAFALAHATATLQAENEAFGRILENEAPDKQKSSDRAWNEGFDFAMKACGWQEGEDPVTEGLYVVRDSRGTVEVGMWYAKTLNSQPAEWSRDFRDVDRDDIVAWMAIPDWRTARAALRDGEAT